MMYQNNGFNPYANTGYDPYNPMQQQQMQPTPQINPYGIGNGVVQQNPQMPQQKIDPRVFETPTITMGETHKPMFSVSKEGGNTIKVENASDMETESKRRRKNGEGESKKKKEVNTTSIVRVDEVERVNGEIVDSTIFTYGETNSLLHETLGQIDAVNAELVQEFNAVKQNRTMKNKYGVLNALAENIGSMVSNRISTIKEINNCITKANDLDYKKYKDVQAAQNAMNDDKYIADIYQAFLQNPQNQAPTYQMPALDQSIVGSSIVRANVPALAENGSENVMDAGYLGYISSLTPEQNLMRYENDPNVKQVVVYDAMTGNKFFQMMNVSTGEVIPNVPVYDDLIMEDTTLDLKTGIAKNLNLRESFPIVQINNNVASQY